MNDQASTLRIMALTSPSINTTDQITLTKNIALKKTGKQVRSLAITGGKGGVGKSNLAVNLAFELGALNYQVGLLDADLGLANADILCGISPKFHLGHVVTGLKDLEDTIIKLSDNVSLIPGGSGIEELAKFSFAAHPHILAKLLMMEENLDFMLIDTAAGIAENVLSVLISAAQVIIVATPEPTSIVDAYATIKVILRHAPKKSISIVVNNAVGIGDAEQVFNSLNSAVQNFLGHRVEFLGMIPHDTQLPQAVREQVPLVHFAPDSPASRAIRLIAKQLHNQKQKNTGFAEVQSFWDMLSKN